MKNPLKDKSKKFGLLIIRLSKNLSNAKEFVLADQLLRSWTSIGALIRESEYAQSRNDLKSKLYIALKEANETGYWLELIEESNLFEVDNELKYLLEEIIKMLVSSIKTLWK